jgi:hypothetical protein
MFQGFYNETYLKHYQWNEERISPKKCKGRFGSLTQTGVKDNESFEGSKEGDQGFIHKPKQPQNQGPKLKIKSLSSWRSNSAMKNPLEKGWMKTSHFKTGNQDLDTQSWRSIRRGQRPLKRKMSVVELRRANLEITSFLIGMEGFGASCTKQEGGTTLTFLETPILKELPRKAAEPKVEPLRGHPGGAPEDPERADMSLGISYSKLGATWMEKGGAITKERPAGEDETTPSIPAVGQG